LVVDDWAGCCHNFCKPVAKFPSDREALRQVVKEGHPRFFMGTDSAPHPRSAKETDVAAAGVFVTPFVAQYLATALESFGALNQLEEFACQFGRAFYGLPAAPSDILSNLTKKEFIVPSEFEYVDDNGKTASVVPFLAGKPLAYCISDKI
jgi:dihydroorotase